jgi:IPT/TIG domain
MKTAITRGFRVAVAATLTAIVASLGFTACGEAATVTIGPRLPAEPSNVRLSCQQGSDCTMVNLSLGAAEGTLTSPVDGAVVAWRVDRTQPGLLHALRVLSPSLAGYTATATSAPAESRGEGLETFQTDLPIEAGQTIGLDLPVGDEQGVGAVGLGTSGVAQYVAPRLSEGETRDGIESPIRGFLEYDADVLPAPTVTAAGPRSGPAGGGTTVTIQGTDLEYVESVTFGSAPATYTVDSETEITAVSPVATSATAPIIVTTEAGPATAPEDFIYEGYVPPVEPPTSPPIERAAPPSPSFSIGRPSLNTTKGTATLPVSVPGAGTLSVRATGIATPTHLREAGMGVDGPGTVSLPLSLTPAGHVPLRRKGKIRVVPLVTFTPSGGSPTASYRPVVLKLKRR